MTVVPHGVRLSLGGAEPVDPARVAHLAAVAQRLDAPLVSEHIAFVRAGGLEAGHLLPLPRSREAVDAVCANVARAQAELPVPIALEPIAALVRLARRRVDRGGLPHRDPRPDRRTAAAGRGQRATPTPATGAADPLALLDRLPLERVAYAHVAGGAEHGGFYHDTHTDAVPTAVLELVGALCARQRPPALLLERDGHYPPAADLRAELDALAAAAGFPAVT